MSAGHWKSVVMPFRSYGSAGITVESAHGKSMIVQTINKHGKDTPS